ncbi:cell division protein FtsA [bacterium]|nr:cell division protein FtsA [bacterium]
MITKELFALDLGTTKFCLATVRFNPNSGKPTIKKTVVPAGGMRRGMLSNMEEAADALNKLLDLAEKDFARDIREVVVGVAGSHLSGKIGRASLDVGGEVITNVDQDEVLTNCKKNPTKGLEILHNIPLSYQVDSRECVDSAVGFSGDFLKCESFIIEADKNYLKDIIRLCNNCGLQVQKLYAEPFASSCVTVPYSLKQAGVAIADIGGGTTDGIVFKNGKPIKLFTVNIAGRLITSDLSIGLQITDDDAKTIKHKYGLTGDTTTTELEKVTGEKICLDGHIVNRILSCRIDELYQLIDTDLGPISQLLSGGLILTGGGSELRGICDHISNKFDISCTKIKPEIPKLSNHTTDPGERVTAATKFATVAGLLYLAIEEFGDYDQKQKGQSASKYLKTFVNWLKEIA